MFGYDARIAFLESQEALFGQEQVGGFVRASLSPVRRIPKPSTPFSRSRDPFRFLARRRRRHEIRRRAARRRGGRGRGRGGTRGGGEDGDRGSYKVAKASD